MWLSFLVQRDFHARVLISLRSNDYCRLAIFESPRLISHSSNDYYSTETTAIWLSFLVECGFAARTSFIANYPLKTHKYSKKSGYYLHNPLKKSNFVRFFTKKTEHTKQGKDEK